MEIAFDQLLIQTINGVVTGMILALVASGLTLIFGIMDVVNFAHGELFMLGAYVGVIILAATGDFWIALAAATLLIALLGAVIYLTTLRPLLGRDPLYTILATFGVSLVLQNYALWQFGPVARKIEEPFTGQFTLFYLSYPWYRIVIALLSAAIIGALWLFLKFGTWGIWIRATTQDRVMAQAMGIPVPWVLTGVFAIGAGMAPAALTVSAPARNVRRSISRAIAPTQFVMISGEVSASGTSWVKSSRTCCNKALVRGVQFWMPSISPSTATRDAPWFSSIGERSATCVTVWTKFSCARLAAVESQYSLVPQPPTVGGLNGI